MESPPSPNPAPRVIAVATLVVLLLVGITSCRARDHVSTPTATPISR